MENKITIIFCTRNRKPMAPPFRELIRSVFNHPDVIEIRFQHTWDVVEYIKKQNSHHIIIFDKSMSSWEDSIQRDARYKIGKFRVEHISKKGETFKFFSLDYFSQGVGEKISTHKMIKKIIPKYVRSSDRRVA